MSATTGNDVQVAIPISKTRGFGERITSLRLLPAIDTYPPNIAFAQTAAGKLLLVPPFILVFRLLDGSWWNASALGITLLATSLFPQYRRWIVSVGTMIWLFHGMPNWFDWTIPEYVAKQAGVAHAFNFVNLERLSLLGFLSFSAPALVRLSPPPCCAGPEAGLDPVFGVWISAGPGSARAIGPRSGSRVVDCGELRGVLLVPGIRSP
jgi:hypothetical protein